MVFGAEAQTPVRTLTPAVWRHRKATLWHTRKTSNIGPFSQGAWEYLKPVTVSGLAQLTYGSHGSTTRPSPDITAGIISLINLQVQSCSSFCHKCIHSTLILSCLLISLDGWVQVLKLSHCQNLHSSQLLSPSHFSFTQTSCIQPAAEATVYYI